MANKGPTSLTAASALGGTELFHGIQSGNSRKITINQTQTYVLSAFGANGIQARTAAGAFSARTITAPAAGVTFSNGDGVAGNPTLALANDLAALEGLGSTGIAARTAADTWAQRTLQAPAAGLTISNPAGVAGDPTFALANDLAAYEGLAANGMVARTGDGTASVRTITGTSGLITITNGDGVAGNPTITKAFSGAKVRKTAALTGQNLTGSPAVTFDAEDWDTDGYHSLVSNTERLVPPSAGYYEVRGNLRLSSVAASNLSQIFITRYNSSDVSQETLAEANVFGATTTIRLNVSGTGNFAAGDYAVMAANVSPDTSVDIDTATYFEIRRVG